MNGPNSLAIGLFTRPVAFVSSGNMALANCSTPGISFSGHEVIDSN